MQNGTYATLWRQAIPRPAGIARKSKALVRSAILHYTALRRRAVAPQFLRCLYCHYVFDDQREGFERLLLRLKGIGKFIDTDTCLQMLQGQRPVDGRYYHLSFDGGFRNNFTNALPIVQKQGIPTLFFVSTALIGAPWEQARRHCLETTWYKAPIEMMRWDDLRAIAAAGQEVGSQGRTHVRFREISHNPARLEEEILGSKQDLEAQLGRECKYIAWPYGQLPDVDSTALKMVTASGYRACFGGYRGTLLPGRTYQLTIPRHYFEVQWPLAHVEYFARGNMEVHATA